MAGDPRAAAGGLSQRVASAPRPRAQGRVDVVLGRLRHRRRRGRCGPRCAAVAAHRHASRRRTGGHADGRAHGLAAAARGRLRRARRPEGQSAGRGGARRSGARVRVHRPPARHRPGPAAPRPRRAPLQGRGRADPGLPGDVRRPALDLPADPVPGHAGQPAEAVGAHRRARGRARRAAHDGARGATADRHAHRARRHGQDPARDRPGRLGGRPVHRRRLPGAAPGRDRGRPRLDRHGPGSRDPAGRAHPTRVLRLRGRPDDARGPGQSRAGAGRGRGGRRPAA